MLEKILDVEREAFLWLNGAHTPFFDRFMWFYSGKIAWLPLAVMFVAVYIYANRARWKEALLVFVAIAMVIFLCDQFSSGFCKPFFARFRPTHHPDFKDIVQTVFDYRGGRYGFISGHAANSFGFATLTSLIFRYRAYTLTLFAWATVNVYSRIYLGVHFISDILAGALAGILIGWIVYRLYIVVRTKLLARLLAKPTPLTGTSPAQGLNIILCLLIITIIIMMIVALY